MFLEIYTDGCTDPDSCIGGWAFYQEGIGFCYMDEMDMVYRYDFDARYGCGGSNHSTTPRMELMAMVEGLKHANDVFTRDTVMRNNINSVWMFSKSKYVVNGCNKLLGTWMTNNFRAKNGALIHNKDVWITLDHFQKNLENIGKEVKFSFGDNMATSLSRYGMESYGGRISSR